MLTGLSRAQAAGWVVLLLVLVWAPLPLGSNRAWALALLALLLVAAWAAVMVSEAFGRALPRGGMSVRPLRCPPHGWPLLLLSGHAALVACQAVVLPWGWLGLAPDDAPVWRAVSVEPFATQQYLLDALACTAAFALVCRLATTARRVKLLLLAVVAAGLLQAAVALRMFSAPAEFRYLFMVIVPGTRLGGTFANPDHLAGFMELCLAAGTGWMLAHMGQPMRQGGPAVPGWRAGLAGGLRFALSGKMLLRVLLIILVICLVMTHSRMGNAAFFLALTLVGGLCAWRCRALRRPALWLVCSMVLVDLVVVGQWVGLDKVVERLAATTTVAEETDRPPSEAVLARREESLEERVRAARYAMGMVRERPVLGFGGGTFYVAFPPYKGERRLGFYDHVHNDYVEIAVDTGLVGLALLAALVVSAGWRSVRALGDASDPLSRGVAATVLMAIFSLALHSLVDFNLQIPATAVTFTVLLALAWCIPAPDGRSSRSRPPAR